MAGQIASSQPRCSSLDKTLLITEDAGKMGDWYARKACFCGRTSSSGEKIACEIGWSATSNMHSSALSLAMERPSMRRLSTLTTIRSARTCPFEKRRADRLATCPNRRPFCSDRCHLFHELHWQKVLLAGDSPCRIDRRHAQRIDVRCIHL